MTFSIVARSDDGESWGVAVASKFLAVGSVVPAAVAGVGAIATQAWANVAYKGIALSHLDQGATAPIALQRLLEEDEGRDHRQVGIVDLEAVGGEGGELGIQPPAQLRGGRFPGADDSARPATRAIQLAAPLLSDRTAYVIPPGPYRDDARGQLPGAATLVYVAVVAALTLLGGRALFARLQVELAVVV